MIKIYALINPLNNHPFYVGATVGSLNIRLIAHCSPITWIQQDGIFLQKAALISSIKDGGLRPLIILLKEVLFTDVDMWEKHYYETFVSCGFNMLQSNLHFKYSINKKSIKDKLCQQSI